MHWCSLCASLATKAKFRPLPWEGEVYLWFLCRLCLQQNPSFMCFFPGKYFLPSALYRQMLPPLLMPDQFLYCCTYTELQRANKQKQTQYNFKATGDNSNFLLHFFSGPLGQLNSEKCWLFVKQPPTPNVKVQDYNGVQLKGMYNFSPGSSIIYILDKRKSNPVFFLPQENYCSLLKSRTVEKKEKTQNR